jgi:L-serine deaminase
MKLKPWTSEELAKSDKYITAKLLLERIYKLKSSDKLINRLYEIYERMNPDNWLGVE